MVGIDRILLKDLNIGQADKDILRQNGFLVIDNDKPKGRILKDSKTGENMAINYIKVSKKQNSALLITELKIGIEEFGGVKRVEYEHLDATLPRVISERQINDKNIESNLDLNNALLEIEKELEVLGFGKVDLLESQIKEIEINQNILINGSFADYQEPLEYIRGLLPKRMKSIVNCSHEPKGIYTGFQVGNGSINLKIYDKRTNIANKHNQDLGAELLRVEYSLLNEDKIKSVLGTNNLRDIERDFNVLAKGFNSLLESDLINRVYKDVNKQIAHAVAKINEYKGIGGISAINNYLKNHQANLLDIEILLAALRKTESSKHYSRQCQQAIKSAKEIEGRNLFGNINKINELLRGLGYAEIKIDMTKSIKKAVEKMY